MEAPPPLAAFCLCFPCRLQKTFGPLSGFSLRKSKETDGGRETVRERERERELGATSNKSLYLEFEGHYNLWHDIDLQ